MSGNFRQNPSRRFVLRGALAGLSFLFAYLIIVIATTPSQPPPVALKFAFLVNWWAILGFSVGVGIQTYLIAVSKNLGCNFRARKQVFGASGLLSGFSSFLSYFALVSFGCCGTWL